MATKQMFHVTDESNAESIKENGLKTDPRGLCFLTTSKEEAEYIGEIYDTIETAVVFEATVMESSLREDPDPHGDLDSYAHSGQIMPVDLEVA